MKSKINIDGLSELKASFKKMEQNAKELEGENNVSFDELFNHSFMKEHTNHQSFQSFVDEFEPSPDVKFEDFDDSKFDDFVKNHSSFNTWEEMYTSAVGEYSFTRLFDGI
ncbi:MULTISPECIES: hypothetical protein [Macrococcoides]|uniref:Uncharacterized protein n=1 Tax=Macrococcoides caseolyticum TaxID=69966 RepID=A0A855GMF7_9STAP|nr:hypothetical protein [Macrococcus]PKE27119.1 hypothetical protein CW686_01355 [Macrococcus caseolyticus]PKE59658.1 hypothetical protein CW673_01585 [Macrococcus caseolyticus]PKE71109.1 hypothetical protein CW662_01020 [Macrococcus caseolyticus]TDM24354.1 hypothetical protein ETI02_00730 [Macrococcus canis]